METDHNHTSKPTINRLLKSTLKTVGAIGTSLWAAEVLSV